MTLKELVKDKTVRFMYYRDGELTYQTQDGFEFPVPISDTGTGTFKAEDKAIFFMRWIRKRLEEIQTWEKEAYNQSYGAHPLYEDPYENPEQKMSEKSAKVLMSILTARIPEENILRFSEEDIENMP